MITENDLLESIAKYQGELNPRISTCIKLAACYIVLDKIRQNQEPVETGYSYAPAPVVDTYERYIDYQRDTELSKLIDGKEAYPVWEVMDELLQTLKMIMPPLYSGTMQKIKSKVQ